MIYKESKIDLFTAPANFYLVHCISADAAMGAGIAIEFVKRFPQLKRLREFHNFVGDVILVDRVFNLVTKEKYNHKPTYTSIQDTLIQLKERCIEMSIDKIAMPKIGCGLDKLEWDQVKEIIHDLFSDTDIKIVVCYL